MEGFGGVLAIAGMIALWRAFAKEKAAVAMGREVVTWLRMMNRRIDELKEEMKRNG